MVNFELGIPVVDHPRGDSPPIPFTCAAVQTTAYESFSFIWKPGTVNRLQVSSHCLTHCGLRGIGDKAKL